ncbi:response regulator [Cohnella sp. WQ 127256]|uniref:response regulator transcription factor n=1 Tax=Cohnella sp. WQ 127256 TaxID=2938790 RepID=UPI002117F06C|nr:response regulator [Cohnella sp. WQ 127256]
MIKVMVIEDERILRKGLVMTTPWQSYGCEIIGEVGDGIEGKRLIHKLQPDIVITDIRMPGMDGIEMMREVCETVDTEFILITGFSDFTYAKAAVDLGAQGFILKPIDDEEFEAVLLKTVEVVNKKKRYDFAINNHSSSVADFYEKFSSYVNTKSNDRYLTAAIDYINNNIEKSFSIKDIADYLHISESYLSKLFKNKTSFTFLEYCTNFRIKKAADLLIENNIKVYEVADKVGYQDSRYFSTLFKKGIGLTPTEFRNYYLQENVR